MILKNIKQVWKCKNLVSILCINTILAIQKKLELHSQKLINAIPMYKWLLMDEHLVDRGEDCDELGIQRAIKEAHEGGEIRGKILPIYR